MLDSSPLQIALCVLVLLDAAIVLSEILIDLHAMRSQFTLRPLFSREVALCDGLPVLCLSLFIDKRYSSMRFD